MVRYGSAMTTAQMALNPKNANTRSDKLNVMAVKSP